MRRLRLARSAALVTGILLTLAVPVHAWADASGSLVSVHSDGHQVDLLVAAEGLTTGSALDPSSVELTVDGVLVPATAVAVSRTDSAAPRRVAVIAVDTSGSMAGAPLAEVKQAALAFLAQVPSDVAVGLVSFNDSVRVAVVPTLDRQVVRTKVAALQAAGSTVLYDGMAAAVGQLGRSGQRLLVVLSDGADTSSRTTLAAVTSALRSGHVTTELVGFRTDPAQTATLRKLASDTGGRLVPASDVHSLVGAFSAAAGSFATQIRVTGTPAVDLSAGSHALSVSMRFGTQSVSGTAAFTVTATSVSSAQPTTAPAGLVAASLLTRPAVLIPLLALVFVGLLALMLAMLLPRGQAATRQNLRTLEAYGLGVRGGGRHGAPTAADAKTGLAQTALVVSERFVERRGIRERLVLRLERADVRMTAGEWVLLRTCAGVVAVALASLLVGNVLIGLVVGVLITWIASHTYLSTKAARRAGAFESALPDTLQLVASSIRTGFSLPQALDAAAQGANQPMSGELNRALGESRLGGSLEDALDRLAERMGSQDLRWTVMAIRIQREVGGNLSEVLHTTAATMRERAAMRRQVRALSAEGRLSAYVLVALPLFLALFLFLTRRAYLSLLWTTPPGLVMSAGACVGMLVGWLWMRKLVDVEV